MLKKYLQPDYLFLISGVLIAVFRFISGYLPLDLPFRNTFFVVHSLPVTLAFLVLFVFFALPYTLFKKANNPLSLIAGWVHYFLTMLPFLLIISIHPILRWYYSDDGTIAETDSHSIYLMMEVTLILFTIGQFVFFVNLSVGLLKLIRKRNKMED